jgi:hypothetical protein
MDATFRYPEVAAHGGALSYVGRVPVLRLAGTPEERGLQAAELALRPAARILDYPLDLVAAQLKSRSLARLALPALDRLGRRLLPRFPRHHRRELLAAAAHDLRRVVRGNTLFDLKGLSPWRLLGCSSLALGADRTRTGGPLLARNLDFFPLGYLHDFGLVTVHRPAGPGVRPFAAVGFPGSVGVFSGMNDAGLAVATHEVFGPPGRGFDPRGEPFAATCRRVLETCATVSDADAVFRGTPRTTAVSVAACDVANQAVFELSPDAVVRRDPDRGAVVCANHFLGPGRADLARDNPFDTLGRLDRLLAVAGAAGARFDLAAAWAALAGVNQGAMTLQSMVFEPRRLALHVALGAGPATASPPTELRLGEWF